MEIRVRAVIEAEISDLELARVVFHKALQAGDLVGIEDGGHAWLTDDDGNTYIGNWDTKISSNPQVAALIDAYHAILGYEFGTFKLPAPVPQAADQEG